MSKSICLFFELNQPVRLRSYKFFDIGKDSHYYDPFASRTEVRKMAQRCYLPANAILLDAIRRSNGAVKVTFSMPGTAIEQLERYAPDVMDSFRELAQTGCVEFLCETYFHSISSVISEQEFRHQVEKHRECVASVFGQTPQCFRNTDFIYSNHIGKMVYDMGFNTVLAEGGKHVMGWQSPNWLYRNPVEKGQTLLLRNYSLSDDISLRFSDRSWNEWPLSAEKYISWIEQAEGDIVNLFMDYETLGYFNPAESGILEFFKNFLARVVENDNLEFTTPSEAVRNFKPVAEISIAEPESWLNEERDISDWLGNDLQIEASNKLYSLVENLSVLGRDDLWSDFGALQDADLLYYMSSRFFKKEAKMGWNSPYETPYDAFINYMNVLSDLIIRVNNAMNER